MTQRYLNHITLMVKDLRLMMRNRYMTIILLPMVLRDLLEVEEEVGVLIELAHLARGKPPTHRGLGVLDPLANLIMVLTIMLRGSLPSTRPVQ